ncbi:uncharacterized protein LOC8054629 [Sorghum bicolor]|uniref:uncharacterized protein LOC8054629 n=1 Tax=Sorghum bicolor TaxID=4558 RepID=UPI000B42520C|nr:uncharacterized protein LOC8054629 [Sorghum bicolor]|eukprot:XP_021312671.1 uncharacterized protein LOC8054629 [Sorghum bicolor]
MPFGLGWPRKEIWPGLAIPPLSTPGTKPDLLPSGTESGVRRRSRAPRAVETLQLHAVVEATAATAGRCETTATRPTPTLCPSPSSSSFSPISPPPFRVGEGEPPPSWDPVPTPEGTWL